METVPAEYSKRVYQGVRVKHTVKDLLAEKRSRQTSISRLNGSVVTSQTSFVPLPGSPSLSSYYGVRRSLMADTDLQSNKQISSDIYSSSLLAKQFTHDSSAVQGYPSLLDTHFTDQYTDHRSAAAITSNASTFFGTSPLASVMASFPSDSTHFLTRDSWDQAIPDSFSQSDSCSDPFQASSSSGCISSHESGSSPQSRTSSWNSSISGTQSYPFHALEDVHYAAGYSATSPYSFSSFMTTVPNDVTLKMPQASSEEPSDATTVHDNNSFWPKDDGNSLWGSYECRRTY